MKKTILMALLIIASATVTTATAGKKDKKKKGNTTMLQPVELTNGIDSRYVAEYGTEEIPRNPT